MECREVFEDSSCFKLAGPKLCIPALFVAQPAFIFLHLWLSNMKVTDSRFFLECSVLHCSWKQGNQIMLL